jgi:hypothetical protein
MDFLNNLHQPVKQSFQTVKIEKKFGNESAGEAVWKYRFRVQGNTFLRILNGDQMQVNELREEAKQ